MARYFVKMAYDGGSYHGWAKQPNSVTVQMIVEKAISTIYRIPIEVLGCGRTDAGVHASCFYFHVDLPHLLEQFVFRMNSILPKDIVFYDVVLVDDQAHARFDAIQRSYKYFAHGHNSPFLNSYSSYINRLHGIEIEQLNSVANLLTSYTDFFPFCKSHADSKTVICDLQICNWTFDAQTEQYQLEVVSDRFLRGMIRLIVGACVLVVNDQLSLDAVRNSMDNQVRLPKDWSAPPEGLFLNNVRYPFIN